MATLPDYEKLLGEFDTDVSYVDDTWEIDWVNKRIKTNTIDGKDAVRQSIYLILNTEIRTWTIYGPEYGTEVNTFIGQPTEIVLGRLQNAITEALLKDDRIARVDGFLFSEPDRGSVAVSFSVTTTIAGTVQVTEEVSLS